MDVKTNIDEAIRPGRIIEQISDLKVSAKKLSQCISGLKNETRSALAHFESKEDHRDIKAILDSTLDNTRWIARKADRVSKKLRSRKPKDTGRPKVKIADRVLVANLKTIYREATGKWPKGSYSASKRKDGKWEIAPFGQFVQLCLSSLDRELSAPAIGKIIYKADKESQKGRFKPKKSLSMTANEEDQS